MNAVGPAAAACWALLCLRWFDAGARFRPGWLEAVPAPALALATALLGGWWLRAHWRELAEPWDRRLTLPVLLALAFRLPLAWQGGAGYVTPDGALSGIVALHLRDGLERLVFVPQVPYSGSLKSHLTALLAFAVDPARAFALVSTLFYALFVLAVVRLGLLLDGTGRVATAAGLWVAFAPPFVTRYSLSNDGNYVEVLGLGTLALLLTVRFAWRPEARPALAVAMGVLLGLAFWCHILAIIHVAAVGLGLLWLAGLRPTLRALPRLGLGLALGYLPGLLWNAGNGWESFHYLMPAGPGVGTIAQGPGPAGRALATLVDLLPVLAGYDPGYPAALDVASRGLAVAVLVAFAAGLLGAARDAVHPPGDVPRLLLLFSAVNLGVAVLALPVVPGNPRYLLFLVAPLSLLLARTLLRWPAILGVVVAYGALGSLAQALPTVASDRAWRGFVADLAREGVRHCTTDFYLATKLSFVSEERIVCSSKLGPTTTEYFFEYRRQVERAPRVALVAVNGTSAEKLERRLARLGVGHRRLDLMKPVLLPERAVDPAELFPERDFPLR